jgi:hypothetical protein
VARATGKQCGSEGLDAVRPPQGVCLMMYYSVQSQPRSLTRTTTYEILQGKRMVYAAEYRTQEPATEIGKQIRYSPYTIAASLPFGLYSYRAKLQIGTVVRQREWQFAVLRAAYIATAHKAIIQGY